MTVRTTARAGTLSCALTSLWQDLMVERVKGLNAHWWCPQAHWNKASSAGGERVDKAK
jgi:hypothetical protein